MFISYSQNFEDVILWRALKHIKNGFYIDIGAQDPVVDSVSRGFYEQGWRGLHVEPTATYAAKLRDNRPDEDVVQAAIGKGDKEISFFEIPETGMSTGDLVIADVHRKNGAKIMEMKVPLMPLNDLFDHIGERDIHWLKIDVEGMEPSVVESWLPSVARPWIVVVESTFPNTQEPTHAGWEVMLIKLGYDYVYFDGLSRYYVSDQHRELSRFFGPGPNVFDGFALADTSGFVSKEKINEYERHIQLLNELILAAQASAHELKNELSGVYSSRSWRLTALARRPRISKLFRFNPRRIPPTPA